jgi:hypothetical protein
MVLWMFNTSFDVTGRLFCCEFCGLAVMAYFKVLSWHLSERLSKSIKTSG